MERPGYERFALVANPFHDLASEGLEEIEVYHVALAQDQAFEAVKQEVLERQRKALVFIVGPLGSGKTQRLKLTQAQATRVGAFNAYVHMGDRPDEPLAALADAVHAAAAAGAKRGLSTPKWLRDLQALRRSRTLGDREGQVLAEALSALAPAFLLLNDFDALPAPQARGLLQVLQSLASHLQPGVLVAAACQSHSYQLLQERLPALTSRVNRVFEAAPFGVEDARLLVAKRMAGRRLIEDLDPLYPFTEEAIQEMTRLSEGSPRRLLQLADVVLEQASRDRAYQVGTEAVLAASAKATAARQAPAPPPKPSPAPAHNGVRPGPPRPRPAAPAPANPAPPPRTTPPAHPPASAPARPAPPARPAAPAPAPRVPAAPSATPPPRRGLLGLRPGGKK